MSIVLLILLYLVHLFGTGIFVKNCWRIVTVKPLMLKALECYNSVCMCGKGSALITNLTITSDHHEYTAYIFCNTDRSLNGGALGFFNIS